MTAAALSFTFAARVFAGQPEALDTEFLDYLAACEGKDDNWTVIADDKQRPEVAEQAPPAKAPPVDKVAAPKTGEKP
jgi:hypothetical protein